MRRDLLRPAIASHGGPNIVRTSCDGGDMDLSEQAGVPVGIIMGSQSDWPTMREAAAILDELGVGYETKIVSAHRTPDRLWAYGKAAVDRGLKVIIAGAGGAADSGAFPISASAARTSSGPSMPLASWSPSSSIAWAP